MSREIREVLGACCPASTGIVSVLKMDLVNPNNHVSSEKVEIGHAAEQALEAAKVCTKDIFALEWNANSSL